MSSQRFRLHRSAPVVAALILAFAFAPLPAAMASPHSTAPAEPHLSITGPGTAVARSWMQIAMNIASNLRSIFQAEDSATGDPAPDAVDPWDDDLTKKPPQ